jgi:hypothetical protein
MSRKVMLKALVQSVTERLPDSLSHVEDSMADT